MEYLCPEIDRLVSCHTCGTQSLPPYRLCAMAHVSCPPCAAYLPRCACGEQFTRNSNSTLDWLVSAMKLRCKYRTVRPGDGRDAGDRDGCDAADRDGCGDRRWYGVEELREHYRTGCARNTFACPLTGCGHVARVDTVVEHYEAAHGPFKPLEPSDDRRPCQVVLRLPSRKHTETVRKIFNGYILFVVSPRRNRRGRRINPRVSMQNINPSDPIRYEYNATSVLDQKELVITVTLTAGKA